MRDKMLVKTVAFRLESELPQEAKSLLEDFRLAVNKAIRVGLQNRVTARYTLTKLAYKGIREDYPRIYSKHVVSAFEVATGILKNYRWRMRIGADAQVPYVRRLMMKAGNQAYKLDRECGIIELPIRTQCRVKLKLIVSNYHRKYLDDPNLSLGSLTLLPDRVLIAFKMEAPKPYTPETILSLDTNERSLDGVFVTRCDTKVARASFPDVAIIQRRHHNRRRRLQKKKANDKRMRGLLCSRKGRREHNRIEYRMHQLANALLSFAEKQKSAIILEDLSGVKSTSGNKGLNRRMAIWPRSKLHRFVEYKAKWRGIPVVKVDPRYSSRKCPICGRIQDSRMGTVFECECGWRLDRHINASINLLHTAVSKELVMAGGIRFDPGAFQHDVMMTLYEPAVAARSEPNGTSCVCGVI